MKFSKLKLKIISSIALIFLTINGSKSDDIEINGMKFSCPSMSAERCKETFYELNEQNKRNTAQNHKKIIKIEVEGGITISRNDSPLIGCSSVENVEKFILFHKTSSGDNPISVGECWKVKHDMVVSIKKCSKYKDICEVEPKWFGKNFWLHIDNLTAR